MNSNQYRVQNCCCGHPLHENNDFIKSILIPHTYTDVYYNLILKHIYQISVETLKGQNF